MSQTPIDWKRVQRTLKLKDDGIPGPRTFAALMAYVAGRAADAAITARAAVLAQYHDDYGLTTAERLAEYLAQTANETGGWRRFEENLRYSAQGLANTWPRRYAKDPKAATKQPNATALRLAGNPQALANDVYAGRMGNTGPNDGWLYRGGGDLQLTGRDNYVRYGQLLGIDLAGQPERVREPEWSVRTALEFWRQARVNAAVDAGDYVLARSRTNGGSIGLAEVAEYRNHTLTLLAP